jgi:hypothetical protein
VGDVFSAENRLVLLQAYGIDDPTRLYLPDSSPGAILRYDLRLPAPSPLTGAPPAHARVGYPSARRRGESWEAFALRVLRTPASAFPASARTTTRSLDALDDEARGFFGVLLADARRAGFAVRVAETRRTSERQAYLLGPRAQPHAHAHLAHMTGRAVDVWWRRQPRAAATRRSGSRSAGSPRRGRRHRVRLIGTRAHLDCRT